MRAIGPARLPSARGKEPRHGVIEQARSRGLHVRDDELRRGRGAVRSWPRPRHLEAGPLSRRFTSAMNERLAFGYGTSGHDGGAPPREPAPDPSARASREPLPVESATFVPRADRRDWAFIGLLTFTGLLFLRPQEHIPALNPLHLAEVSALLSLAAMVMGRVGRGLPVTRYTP